MGDEDGNPITVVNESDIRTLLNNPNDWGIDKLVDMPPNGKWDANYWPEGTAMILRATVVRVADLMETIKNAEDSTGNI